MRSLRQRPPTLPSPAAHARESLTFAGERWNLAVARERDRRPTRAIPLKLLAAQSRDLAQGARRIGEGIRQLVESKVPDVPRLTKLKASASSAR
jgi:hypothetical protein